MIHSDLLLTDLDYPLVDHCIATIPAEPRDSARMMVVRRDSDEIIHAHVRDLPRWLRLGDQLVLNKTKVAWARLFMRRSVDGRFFQGLLAEKRAHGEWLLLVKNGRKLCVGDRLHLQSEEPVNKVMQDATHGTTLDASHGTPLAAELICISKQPEGWLVRFGEGVDAQEALEKFGRTPLPPYILRARKEHTQTESFDRAHYQTFFGNDDQFHSVAAPTAGLHFTPELFHQATLVTNRPPAFVTLEVGMGTFKSVETPHLSQHTMHSEKFSVDAQALQKINSTRPAGRLVIVGTTTVRALESLPVPLPSSEFRGNSSLFIQPGHSFQYVDALLTNFHLPRSTLLCLVGSLVGLDRLKSLYALAQHMDYRFYSYGDAMLIL